MAEIVLAEGATDVLAAPSDSKMNELWTMRRAVGTSVKSVSVYKEEDTVVPRANLVALLLGVKEISGALRHPHRVLRPRRRRQPPRQHPQDGHDRRTSGDEQLDPAIREIFELTVSLGGLISGEHGIGWVQRKYLPIAMSARRKSRS